MDQSLIPSAVESGPREAHLTARRYGKDSEASPSETSSVDVGTFFRVVLCYEVASRVATGKLPYRVDS